MQNESSTDDEFGAPVLFDSEFLVPDATLYAYARWDDTQTQMVVSIVVDGETDLYYSACQ